MFKKVTILLMILVISLNVLILQPLKPQAVGVDTVLKLVGGKAVVRALAEKAGMALSRKQLDNVAGYIEKKTFDGDINAINFVKSANSVTGTTSKTGWKKYLLDAGLWLSGLDLVIGAVSAFRDGYDDSTPVPVWGQCAPRAFEGISVTASQSYIKWFDAFNNRWTVWVYNAPDFTYQWDSTNKAIKLYPVTTSGTKYVDVYQKPSNSGVSSTANYSFSYTNGVGSSPMSGTINADQSLVVVSSTASVCQETIDSTEVVNVSNVNPTVYNNFDNDTYYTGSTYVMEADIPDTPNYDDVTPWNSVDNNLPKEVVDPNAPPADAPEHSSWWEWLLAPLKAIGEFIATLGDFLSSLFVPEEGSITESFTGVKDAFSAKIPIADQLGTFFGGIKETTHDDTQKPTFKITLPPEYGGGTFDLIDFSYFDDYRDWVLNFIRFSSWFMFLRRLYNRIPKMIY